MKKQLILALCLATHSALAERILPNAPIVEFEAMVVGIIDGDTVDIYREGYEQARCRLASIDAPERGQAYGQRAKQALSTLIYRQTVLIGVVDVEDRTDRANRLICTIQFGGLDINGDMVQQGMAWYSRGYLRVPEYRLYEQQAQAQRLGMWQDPNPVYPGDYRRR